MGRRRPQVQLEEENLKYVLATHLEIGSEFDRTNSDVAGSIVMFRLRIVTESCDDESGFPKAFKRSKYQYEERRRR